MTTLTYTAAIDPPAPIDALRVLFAWALIAFLFWVAGKGIQ